MQFMTHSAEKYSAFIKAKAKKFGFQDCGISKAEFLEADAKPLENWLKSNYHGEMSYMENHFDKRLDPTLLVEGSRSVISLSYNYFPSESLLTNDNFKISKYAYGEDYHEVIKAIPVSYTHLDVYKGQYSMCINLFSVQKDSSIS